MSATSPGKLPAYVEAMLDPTFYAQPTQKVEFIQTHISYVLLTDDTVYKVKKAVRFSFLDFSTRRLRRHFCHEEVRLNRRLAPAVYDGVLAVIPQGDAFALGREDHPDAVDYAVVMRRLPSERMLASLLARNEVAPEMMDAIVSRLVAFHDSADCGPEVRHYGDPARILQLMDEDFSEMARFRGKTISAEDDDAIQQFCREGTRRFSELLTRRLQQGRVREGHGDLHSENICLVDPIVVFDCIEFSRAFRCRDVAAEVAFLAMDLKYRDSPDLSRLFLRRYAEVAGDAEVVVLAPLFEAHRAYIRGKVDSLKSDESDVDDAERREARDSAYRHFDLAYSYTWSATPVMAVVVGLSGSGKSTVARRLARRTGFAHFNSDVVRKRLAGMPLASREGAGDEAGLYGPEHSAKTYARMFALAAAELRAGRGAVLDATFQRRSDRDEARRVAESTGTPVVFIECRCEPDEVIRRLRARAREGGDPSDADEEIYRRQTAAYEPFAADEPVDHFAVDTAAPQAEVVRRIETDLRATIDRR